MPEDFKRSVTTPEEMIAKREKHERERREAEERKQERDSHIREVGVSWTRIKKEVAITELMDFLKMRREMVNQVAITGVGQEVKRDAEGKDYVEIIRFTSEQRISQLDRVAGLDEAIEYIERHCA